MVVLEVYNIGSLFNRFPRNIGTPRQVQVNTWSEFLYFLNIYNGKTRFFSSLYPTSTPTYIDKLWYDFDGYQHLNNIRYYHSQLKKHDLSHLVVMSGGGFHIYVFNEPFMAKDNEQFSIVKQGLVDEFGFEGYGEESIGDIRRVVGVPGTKNTKRGYFVTSLTSEELEKPLEEILYICSKPRTDLFVYGTKLYKVEDIQSQQVYNPGISIDKIDKNPDKIIEIALGYLPVSTDKFNFRFSLIIYMFENLYTVEEVIEKIEVVDPSKDKKTYSDRKKQVISLYSKRFEYRVSTDFFRTIYKISSPKEPPIGVIQNNNL